MLQALEGRARVDAELLDQLRSGAAQDVERVGLAVAAVEREGEQAPRVLAPRVLGDVGVELGDDRGRVAEREPGLGAALDRVQPELGQAGALGARPVPAPRTPGRATGRARR